MVKVPKDHPCPISHRVKQSLVERELIVRYKGGCSSRKSLPGGGLQETRLGLYIILILINAARYGQLEQHMGQLISQKVNKRNPISKIHMKYVDDLSMI